MKKAGMRIGIVLLVLVFMMSTVYAAQSSEKPAGYESVSVASHISLGTDGVKKILLIEDQLPWGFNSNREALTKLGLSYDTVNAAGLPDVSWNNYSLIIVASDQPQYLYDALAPYISPRGALHTWVKSGGVLNFHAAAWAWQESNWTLAFKLPGGISAVNDYQDNVMATRVALPLPPESGPYQAISDSDLNNWGSSTHGYFQYAGGDVKPSKVIPTLTITDAPTHIAYVAYKFGKGAVLASMQPLEWGYHIQDNGMGTPYSRDALLNDIQGGRDIDNLIS